MSWNADWNPHSDPVARELHDANANLRHIGDQLGEMNQPPAVRAARQADRAAHTRMQVSGIGVVLGLAAVWVVLGLVFGRAGHRLFGSLLGFIWDALNVLLVVGAVAGVLVVVVRVGRTVFGVSRRDHADGAE